MRTWVTPMAILSALAACTTGEPAATPSLTPSNPPSSPTVTESSPPTVVDRHPGALDCAYARPEDVGVVDGEEVVLDAVALPAVTLQVGPPYRTSADASPANTVLRFAKRGLVVRRNATVEIGVPEEARGRLYLRWGEGTEEMVDRVIVDRCDHKEAKSGWIWFVGGYHVTKPGCYPITVVSHGRSQKVYLSIGVPCGSRQR